MAITPEEIESKQFAIGLRGYDQQEVSAFLRDVAADYKDALEKGRSNGGSAPAPAPTPADPYSAMGDEVAAVLRSAREAAGDVKRRAEQEAEALLAKAREEASELESNARRHVQEGEAAARETRHKAEEEAAATRDQAKRDADAMLEDAVARYQQLVRDEQDLGTRLRGIAGDIDSALARIPAPAPGPAEGGDGHGGDGHGGDGQDSGWNAS